MVREKIHLAPNSLAPNSFPAAAATAAVPIGMLIDTLFLALLILLLKYGLITARLLSLASWFILAFLAQKIHSIR